MEELVRKDLDLEKSFWIQNTYNGVQDSASGSGSRSFLYNYSGSGDHPKTGYGEIKRPKTYCRMDVTSDKLTTFK
jgi:hypothetical protein